MIKKDAIGAEAALPFSLVVTSTGLGTAGHVWVDAGGGLTAQFKVQCPSGTPGTFVNAAIARIVEIGGGNYTYQLDAGESADPGKVFYYPNVALHDGDELNADWEDIVDIGSGATLGAGAITLATFATDALQALGIMRSGTAQAGSAVAMTLDAGASSANGAYVDGTAFITGGTGAGQVNTVTGYVGASKVASFAAKSWVTAPDATSTFLIFAASSPLAAAQATIEGTDVEDSNTLGDLIRLLVAVLFGLGADYTTDTTVWKSLDQTKVRGTNTYDETGRTGALVGDTSP